MPAAERSKGAPIRLSPVNGLRSRLPAYRQLRELRLLWDLGRLARSGDERQRYAAGLTLLDKARARLAPGYRLGEHGKAWWRDDGFFDEIDQLTVGPDFSAERKFFLRELLKLVESLEGDTAEAGVYRGASSWFICRAREGRGSRHFAIDSFAGLSAPAEEDGSYWRSGDLRTHEEAAGRVLAGFDATIVKGWIPEAFSRVDTDKLVFAHIDVDLYEPTLASLDFFYPRLVPGGIVVCDDYGFTTCPGARRALDEYMSSRPEPVLESPTGQGFLIKS